MTYLDARKQRRTLLVASTGGHLEQLYRLRRRFVGLDAVEWATFETSQSQNILAGETVTWLPFVKPKDLRGTMANLPYADRLLRSRRFDRVISTGAAIAVPFVARARSLGIAGHYVESAARGEGPSLSGRIVSRIPGVRLYSQYPGWAAGRWHYGGSVFDGFTPARTAPAAPIDRVVVTFGTQRGFGFRRAVERLLPLLTEVCTDSPTILWQTGATEVSDLGVRGIDNVPAAELRQAIGEADLVVSHAGVGTALVTLESGRCPILLPRRRDLGEHTDDHQRYIARELAGRRLALSTDPDDLTADDLAAASRMRAASTLAPSPFTLQRD